MPTARLRLRLVASGRYLYAIGGRTDDEGGPSLTTVERYDPKSNSWTTINPMVESRGLPCAVETKVGKRRVLVVVGGFELSADGTLVQARRTTEVFDPTPAGGHCSMCCFPSAEDPTTALPRPMAWCWRSVASPSSATPPSLSRMSMRYPSSPAISDSGEPGPLVS